MKRTSIGFALLFLSASLFLTVVIPTTEPTKKHTIQSRAEELPIAPAGTYTDWNWPSSDGFYSFDHALTIQEVVPNASYFWAHQFGFIGGDGGYIGLQSNGVRRADGSRGKMAIFSVWETINSEGPACGSFGGEGVGQSCSIAYEWTEGRDYQMRVQRLDSSWWSGWVRDTATDEERFIGKIQTPGEWGGLGSWSVMWTEYFQANVEPISGCEAIPYSRVYFHSPRANDRTISSQSFKNTISKTGCSNSAITTVSDGVIHEMGGTTAPIPTPGNCLLHEVGDANCDDGIDLVDFEIWRQEFLEGSTELRADFNNDGKVSLVDFERWRSEFMN